jgi:hypothetical protein
MGIYFRAPLLMPGEEIQFEATAKRVWTGRSVAGKLVVTNSRVLYMPTWLDTLVSGRPWVVNAEDIRNVQVEEGGFLGARTKGKRGPAGWHETTRIHVGSSSASFAVKDTDNLRSALSRLVTS